MYSCYIHRLGIKNWIQSLKWKKSAILSLIKRINNSEGEYTTFRGGNRKIKKFDKELASKRVKYEYLTEKWLERRIIFGGFVVIAWIEKKVE